MAADGQSTIPSELVSQMLKLAGEDKIAAISKGVSEAFAKQERLRAFQARSTYESDPYAFVVTALKTDDTVLLERYCPPASDSFWHHPPAGIFSRDVFEKLIFDYVRKLPSLTLLAGKGYYAPRVILSAYNKSNAAPLRADVPDHWPKVNIELWICTYCLVETYQPQLLLSWYRESAVPAVTYAEAAIVALWWHGIEGARPFFEARKFKYDEDVLLALKHADALDLLPKNLEQRHALHHGLPIETKKPLDQHVLALPYPLQFEPRHSTHRWPYPSIETVTRYGGKLTHRQIIAQRLSQFYTVLPINHNTIHTAVEYHNVDFLDTHADAVRHYLDNTARHAELLLRPRSRAACVDVSVESALAILSLAGQSSTLLEPMSTSRPSAPLLPHRRASSSSSDDDSSSSSSSCSSGSSSEEDSRSSDDSTDRLETLMSSLDLKEQDYRSKFHHPLLDIRQGGLTFTPHDPKIPLLTDYLHSRLRARTALDT